MRAHFSYGKSNLFVKQITIVDFMKFLEYNKIGNTNFIILYFFFFCFCKYSKFIYLLRTFLLLTACISFAWLLLYFLLHGFCFIFSSRIDFSILINDLSDFIYCIPFFLIIACISCALPACY